MTTSNEAIDRASEALKGLTLTDKTSRKNAVLAVAPHIAAQILEDVADLIIGPSENLRDAATCRDIAGQLREMVLVLRGR